jgi:hypothetical protein
MPAKIGFMAAMKIRLAFAKQVLSQPEAPAILGMAGPLSFLCDLVPEKQKAHWRAARDVGKFMSPKQIHEEAKQMTEGRNTPVTSYQAYRKLMNKYIPRSLVTDTLGLLPAVADEEWKLYLAPDTAFDKAVKGALDNGWTVTFVVHRGGKTNVPLKRLEAKRTKGAPSITMWSDDDSGIADEF